MSLQYTGDTLSNKQQAILLSVYALQCTIGNTETHIPAFGSGAISAMLGADFNWHTRAIMKELVELGWLEMRNYAKGYFWRLTRAGFLAIQDRAFYNRSSIVVLPRGDNDL